MSVSVQGGPLGSDDLERHVFHSYPPEPVRVVICDWLRAHGIDPRHVCAPGWIELQFDTRRVFWEAYKLNERGERYFDPQINDVPREVRFLQLESPPLPFPRFPASVARES